MTRFKRKRITKDAAGIKHGFRSGLEEEIIQQLEEYDIKPNYESVKLEYTIPAGEHYVYIKYRKDGGSDQGNDSLQFKIPSSVQASIIVNEKLATEKYVDKTHYENITGYSSSKTQVLKNINGTLTWVDEA